MDKDFFKLDQMPDDPQEALGWISSRYIQVFGWISEPDKLFLVKFLPRVANEFNDPIHIIEIGVFNGGSTRGFIALTGGYLTGIDNWSAFIGAGESHLHGIWNSGEEQFWNTLKYHVDLSSHVKRIISGNSNDVGQTWNEPINLILIDADHQYETSIADMRLFCPWVVQNGYVLVDDYDQGTVRRAVGEYFYNGEWEIIREPDISTTAKMFCAKKK